MSFFKEKTLNKYLQDLIALSKFDTSISQFDPKIENQKAKLAVFVETAEALKVSINSVYLEIDELKSKRTKNNIHLAELKTKLDQIAKKNKEVTNEKELKALQLEEEIAKEQVSFANEEIERFDKLTVAKEEKLKELQEKLKTEEEDIKWGSDEDEDDLKRLEMGATFGAGLEFGSFLIGANYDLGLSNISSYQDGGATSKNRVIRFSVGYRF